MKITTRPCFTHPKESTHKLGRLAIIDIGSSMIRLVVYDEGPYPHLLLNHKVWTALGKGRKGGNFVLEQHRIDRTFSAIQWFLWVCEQAGVKSVLCFASSAVRDAQNGQELVDTVRDKLGLHIEVIEGDVEAQLSAVGAKESIPDAEGLVIDLGGGSLDICETGGKQRVESIPLGVLSLQAQSNGCPVKAAEILRENISKLKWLKEIKSKDLLALGSGMRSIARLHMAERAYPIKILHDYQVDRDDIIEFCTQFMEGQVSRRLSGMTRTWREVLPYRAAAIRALMKETNASRIRFASFGIREGLLFTQLDKDVMQGDPLIAFAKDSAERLGRGVKYSEDMSRWVQGVLKDVEPRLIHAAALFCENVWREQPTYRAANVFEHVFGGSFVAATHNERVRLALMAFFRHEDSLLPGMLNRFKGVVSAVEMQEARQVGALFHLASYINPGACGDFSDFKLRKVKGSYQLDAPEAFLKMQSESVSKRLEIVNKVLA